MSKIKFTYVLIGQLLVERSWCNYGDITIVYSNNVKKRSSLQRVVAII